MTNGTPRGEARHSTCWAKPKTCPVCGGDPAFTAQPNYEGFCDEHIPPLPVLTEKERDAMNKRFLARQSAEREADRQHAMGVWLEAKRRGAREKAKRGAAMTRAFDIDGADEPIETISVKQAARISSKARGLEEEYVESLVADRALADAEDHKLLISQEERN